MCTKQLNIAKKNAEMKKKQQHYIDTAKKKTYHMVPQLIGNSRYTSLCVQNNWTLPRRMLKWRKKQQHYIDTAKKNTYHMVPQLIGNSKVYITMCTKQLNIAKKSTEKKKNNNNRDFAFFFVFERTKHQPRRNLRSYLVWQRPCNEAALSPGIDAFWY